MHEVAGVPHVFWQTPLGSEPSGPGAASGSDNGRFSLASKSQVQCVAGSGAHAAQQAMAAMAALSVARMRYTPLTMRAGVWNLGFGLVAIAAGASGKFALIGTSGSTGSTLLVVAGVALAALGVFQLWKNKGR